MTEIKANRDGHEEYISKLGLDLITKFDVQNPFELITAVRHIGDLPDPVILTRLYPHNPDQQILALGPLKHIREEFQIFPRE